MLYNASGVLKVLQPLSQVNGRALVGVQGVKPLKIIGPFTAGGQINGLK